MAEAVGSIRDPFGTRTAPRPGPKEGDTRKGGRLTYKNGKWVETFNIREGQQSTLNGKPVTADGQGNWEKITYNSDGTFSKEKVGTYKPGIRYGSEGTIPPINAPSVLNLNKSKPSDKKPPAPAKPANTDKPLPYGSLPGGDNPDRSAAQPGAGPKGNTVGSDADPDTPGLQGPGAPKSGARVNSNGLVSYGKDLSSLNAFTSAFTGGYEVADIKSAFQSEDLPTAYNGSNKVGYQETPYELPEGSAPSPLDKGLAGAQGLTLQDSGYKIGESSVPGTVGRSGSAQEGSSSKPDIAEEVRTIRMNRNAGRGSRRDPRNRGEDADMFGGPEPSDASLVSPMYANKKRNEIRNAFFAGETSVKGAVAANAVANYGKDSNADARFNVGGELVYAKEGMQQKAKNAAMMGKDPREFLDIPTTPDTQPDSPAATELSPSFAKETPGAQEFFKTELQKVKDKTK